MEAAKHTDWLDKSTSRDVGRSVVKEMNRMIANGLSPVRGEGRFVRYSDQRGGNYPSSVRGRFPNKKTRPVNLWLNGWYLSFLTYWFNVRKKYVAIGFSSKEGTKQPVPGKVRDYFEAHNEGMNRNVPKRKHLPNDEGDKFAVSVERVYRKFFEQAVKSAINKMNKK